MKKNKGAIKLQVIISLLTTLMIIPIIYQNFTILVNYDFHEDELQDNIALLQLRRILLESKEITCMDQKLRYEKNNKKYELRFINHHFIISPGTQIIISNADFGYIYQENDRFYLTFYRKGEKIIYEI